MLWGKKKNFKKREDNNRKKFLRRKKWKTWPNEIFLNILFFLNLGLLTQKQDRKKDKYLYLFKSGMLDSYSNMLITGSMILDNLLDLFES